MPDHRARKAQPVDRDAAMLIRFAVNRKNGTDSRMKEL